jgi:hypothetical protein
MCRLPFLEDLVGEQRLLEREMGGGVVIYTTGSVASMIWLSIARFSALLWAVDMAAPHFAVASGDSLTP